MSDPRQRDIYIAIMVAGATGRGVHLTWDECAQLALDDAIRTRASNTLEEGEFAATAHGGYLHDGWGAIDPYRERANPYNGRNRDINGNPA